MPAVFSRRCNDCSAASLEIWRAIPVLEAEARQEPMQEISPTVMRQRRRAKLDCQLSRSSGHGNEGS